MRVFIAEKPDLAKVIADALGGASRKKGYILCGTDAVTWCVGHLLELAPPEVHNPAYANWDKNDLPMKLRPVKYQPIAKTEEQLQVVGRLIDQATEIVHAGDIDDEGQLLVDEVLEYFNNESPVQRILINDMSTSAATVALGQLRDNKEFYGLYQKALARSIGDQLYGFNMTRAYTLAAQERGFKGVLSVGRVQTVILGLIVNRYLANRRHSAAFFHKVSAAIDIGTGKVKANLVVAEGAPVDAKGRIIDAAYADKILKECTKAPATVVHVEVEHLSDGPKLPFALLDLQVHMSNQHGISADKTLELTQSLRDNHKAITYNRSDCSYLSEMQFGEAPQTIDAVSQNLPGMAAVFAEVESERKSRAFDDSKITAHTAIIPTAAKVDVSKLTPDEKSVYLAIVTRYLMQFMPAKLSQRAEVRFEIGGHTFTSRATLVTAAGWSVLDGGAGSDDDAKSTDENVTDAPFELLSGLQLGNVGNCGAASQAKEKTKPPELYTEATLLKDLRRVAKYVIDPRIKKLLIDRDKGKKDEHGGIGTPATRAAMLKLLLDRGLYTIEKKKLVPTPVGLEFVAALPTIATSPDMTALWHEQQEMIEAGELTVDAFLDELEVFIAEQIANVDLGSMQGQAVLPPLVVNADCPMCGKELAVNRRVIGCKACEFKFFPEICGKQLTGEQIERLFTTGQTAKISGFKKKDKKHVFAAALKLNHLAKVEFVY
ncbi:type IA DNA topoisomerase [Pseudomonas viridiflava]|uniref:type IA DNA topoisomerase n=1 Tax=Pseudomonas viridiflava TaxID=33069 RepID=UPI000F025A49|nr:type IA DNA topoisomerase [Pseudomonas viridiflava]